MWKAGTAVFTMLLNNVFARIAGSSSKTVSDLNLEFSCSFGECFEESIFCLLPVSTTACSPWLCSACRELKESQGNGTSRDSPVCQPEERFHFHTWCPRMRQRLSLSSFPALPFLPSSMLNSASWRKMSLKSKGFCTLLARIKMQMKSETWGRWEHLTLCLSQCHDAEDHKSHLSLKTSTFSCPH